MYANAIFLKVFLYTDKWSAQPIETWAQKCMFGRDSKFTEAPEDSIYCISYSDKRSSAGQEVLHGKSTAENPLELTQYLFESGKRTVLMKHAIEFYPFETYMALATVKMNLRVVSSISYDMLLHRSFKTNSTCIHQPTVQISRSLNTHPILISNKM
jgi:hypothetical protein